ncbi:MOXD1 [Branchiostoma lanceolatum]|uniref:MOXD1 protein n=1 Tax=Branchiostoma lanceolatum TaxID=7740 RepID=A0A8J9YN88_BRALA|nr:MOXD1 [Branchiostoma lanceolatum]
MAAFRTRLFVVAAVTVMSATCLETTFTHSAYLDSAHEKYYLQWMYDADIITFRVEVATLGYVGFGISPNGDMTGSDIVTGFVTDQGDTFFYDRYATARATPTIDASQDWTLEASGENGTHTFLQFSRNLVLCDDTDRTIKAGTTRVIWAYHEEDPRHDTELMYHGETRGARSLMLLSGPQLTGEMPEDVQSMEFLNDAYAVPYKRVTNYLYRGFKVPDVGGKKHVIAFEPVVQPGHEGLVHHIFLYACLEDLNPDLYDGVQHLRQSPDYPEDWRSCKVTIIAWDVGGAGIHYPEQVGLSVGAPGDPTFLLMETHYNNVQHKKGIKDSSGIRLLYTSQLREYDLGFMQLGMEVRRTQAIPPGCQSFVSVGTCYPDCLENAMEEESIDKINVVGVHFHAHLAARKMRMRHVRNGVELPWLGSDENFDFNFQQTVRLQREVEVLKEVQITGNTSAICLKKDSSYEEYHQQKVTMREPPPVILRPYKETDVCKTPRTSTVASSVKLRKESNEYINGIHGGEYLRNIIYIILYR